MNPIEKLFNQLKYYIRKDEPMNYSLIKKSLKKVINKVDKITFLNYFKSSLKKTKKRYRRNKDKIQEKS